jgi:hypothetical protein
MCVKILLKSKEKLSAKLLEVSQGDNIYRTNLRIVMIKICTMFKSGI